MKPGAATARPNCSLHYRRTMDVLSIVATVYQLVPQTALTGTICCSHIYNLYKLSPSNVIITGSTDAHSLCSMIHPNIANAIHAILHKVSSKNISFRRDSFKRSIEDTRQDTTWYIEDNLHKLAGDW